MLETGMYQNKQTFTWSYPGIVWVTYVNECNQAKFIRQEGKEI